MTSQILCLTPNQVRVDSTVQRGLDEVRAQKIADEFNEHGFGVPIISARDDAHFIIDGQHRIEAARRAGHGDKPFEMKVFTALSREDEAMLFRLHNQTRKPSMIDLFKIGLVEGEPETVAINRIISEFGWTVDNPGRRHTVQAVAALRFVFRKDRDRNGLSTGATLRTTVSVLNDAYAPHHNTLSGSLLQGLGALFFRYGALPNLDLAIVTRTLKKWSEPDSLIGQARAFKLSGSGEMQDAVATIVVNKYNATCRKADKEIPGWQTGRRSRLTGSAGKATGTGDTGE